MRGFQVIYLKELKDLLRDKRTRNSAFFGPMFLVIGMLVMFGTLQTSLGKPSSQTIYTLASEKDNLMIKALETTGVHIKTVSSLAEGQKEIKAGKIRLLLDFPNGFTMGQQEQIGEYYDPSDEGAQIPIGILSSAVTDINQKAVGQILASKGLSAALAEPVKIIPHKLEQGKPSAGETLVGILPYLIVIWSFYGGMGATGDLVAGEKEKSTLETLLLTPVSRTQIALAKLFALGSIAASSAISSLLGVVLVGVANLPLTRPLFEHGIGVSPSSVIVTLAAILPTVFMFSGILLFVSTLSRNIRECYTRLTLVSFLVLAPAIASQFIGYTSYAHAAWIFLVPVLNAAMVMRQAMLGNIPFVGLMETATIGIVVGLIFSQLTVYLFSKENVLLKS